jgi:carboxysome shell carbonic anhydrase
MDTRKRMLALRRSASFEAPAAAPAEPAALPNPACVVGAGSRCEHSLTDLDINAELFRYEQRVRQRFARIVGVLKQISAHQHDHDFAEKAQQLAQQQLGFGLPEDLLERAWVGGLDLRRLHSHCIMSSLKLCVDQAQAEQAGWRFRLPIDDDFLRACGYHTVDISPCADGRLQGLVPFILRMQPGPCVHVKAYAGALFDVESDIADWAQREVERLSGAIAGGERLNYLKVAAYHFSSSNPAAQGCAAHGSRDRVATDAALARLDELREAIDRSFGDGAAPDTLLIGVDTDIDALRIHLPDGRGHVNPHRYVDTAVLYRQTLGMTPEVARARIDALITDAQGMGGPGEGQGSMHEGMRRLVAALAEANISQIEYVVHHHGGRYSVVGHDEECIVVGEAPDPLQLRNLFYYAHLDTIEEGAADLDVGIRIFNGLNLVNGLAAPVLVHFSYDSRVPGSQQRSVARARQVRNAVLRRFADLSDKGQLNCQVAVSDRRGSVWCQFVADAAVPAGH